MDVAPWITNLIFNIYTLDFNKFIYLPQNDLEHTNSTGGMGWVGLGWMDGSLGLVEYRAPYGANNGWMHNSQQE